MSEGNSDERIAEVVRRLCSIKAVIGQHEFEALTRALMKAIGVAAMEEAERRCFLLREPANQMSQGCKIIPFPSK